MKGHHMRRVAAVVSSVLLGVMLLGVGGVMASTPDWSLTADSSKLPTAVPGTVSPGAAAGYTFTITNTGTSNISQLYLTAGFPAVFFQSSRTCLTLQNSPNLFCSLGALNAGQSIDFTVALTVPTSGTTFNPSLQFNTTGSTTTDKKNTSHGDNLNVPVSTALNASPDFAGTFTLDTSTVSTNSSLNKNNVQATSVNPPSAHIPVTVDDSGTVTFDCSSKPLPCSNAFGVWSALNVNNNAPYSGTAFQVTLLLLGKSVPGGVTASGIEVLHVLNDGTVETLSQTGNACPATPSTTTADCIQSVTKVGSNYQIVVWLIRNGGIRGTF